MQAALKRFAVILVAYLLAAVASGYAGTLAMMSSELGFGQQARETPLSFGLLPSTIIAILAAAPAAAVVLLAEYRALRQWWVYALGGMLAGLAAAAQFSMLWWFAWFGAGFGPLAGLIYWAVAGRRAGVLNGQPAAQRGLLIGLGIICAAMAVCSLTLTQGTRFWGL